MLCMLIWLQIFQISVNHSWIFSVKLSSLHVLAMLAVVLTFKNVKVLGRKQTSVADHVFH